MTTKPVQIALLLPPEMLAAVDEARGGTARLAWIRGAIEARLRAEARDPEPTLLDPEPVLSEPAASLAEALLIREAEASVRLDGETQSLPTEAEVAALRAHPVAESMDGTRRHLHRFKDTGRVLRYERGRAIPERQCECGVVAEN